jgi:hypothetical protein
LADTVISGFFAYPSKPPHIAEVINAAVKDIQQSTSTVIRTWEQCSVTGKVIMSELCQEIREAGLFCADITGMNANVMFELGYAIAANKRVWLVLDTSISGAKIAFDQVRVLTTIGYASYCNSADIKTKFLQEAPQYDLENTLFERAIRPSLSPISNPALLYLKSRHETEASIRISKRISAAPIRVIVDDPRESGVQSLTWYGRQLYAAEAVVCHLTNPEREGARLHTARYALVAGMAFGMGKQLLMLSEGDFLAPIDYRDLLRQYRTASEATRFLDDWLAPFESSWRDADRCHRSYAATVELATELKGVQLGEYIAENESDRLVQDYFVETSAYREALQGSHTVFVGRKGTGKTANLLKLASTLGKDRRNLVCVIKPVAYELHGIVELMKKYKGRDLKGYAVETLWKFLLYTEMANATVQSIEGRPDGVIRDGEEAIIRLLDEGGKALREDFSVRLERCVRSLLTSSDSQQSGTVEGARLAISEAVHRDVLGQLRIALGEALRDKTRVVILVDNLDKAWDRQSDLDELAEFLLGLLGASGRVQQDFGRSDSRRQSVNISLCIFLRSDIFYKLTEVAREPDKIMYSRLAWHDPELLLRVVEERFVTSHGGNAQPHEMWSRYFCPRVKGLPIRDYITSVTLARPRDLLFFVKAAVATAVNRGRTMVQESDILDAEKDYSQYALDRILDEDGIGLNALQAVLYEFVGRPPAYSEGELHVLLHKAGIEPESIQDVIDHLSALTFLGIEVADGEFRFAEDRQEHRKNLVLARRLGDTRGGQMRYMVNRAFWAFLEVAASGPQTASSATCAT